MWARIEVLRVPLPPPLHLSTIELILSSRMDGRLFIFKIMSVSGLETHSPAGVALVGLHGFQPGSRLPIEPF